MSPESSIQRGRVALVTGGTGFVGEHLLNALLQAGWQVHAIRRPGSAPVDAADAKAVSWHVHDGTTAGMLAIMRLVKPEAVFHLASLFLAQHRSEDIEGLIASNVLLGAQLLEAMSVEGVRYLINTGTSWQNYQDQEYNPVNLYAATKQAFEDLARYYVEARGLRMVTLRLFDTYGPRDPRPKLLALLKQAAASGEVLEMSPGEQLIDLVHIDDVVAAFLQAADLLTDGIVESSARYAVSSGRPIALKSLVELFARCAGQAVHVNWGGRPYRQREVMRPWARGAALPGWRAQVNLETGLRRFLEATLEC